MTTDLSLTVPDAVSFEQAIDLTQTLIDRVAAATISDAEISATIAALVQTETGARGFFVTTLTEERAPWLDTPTDAVLHALRSSPQLVSELLAKNLAMATAMGLAHRRNGSEELAQGSDRVQRRTIALIRYVTLPQLEEQLQQLLLALENQTGSYEHFLQRWRYDTEQRDAIAQVVQIVLKRESLVLDAESPSIELQG